MTTSLPPSYLLALYALLAFEVALCAVLAYREYRKRQGTLPRFWRDRD